MLRAAPPDLLLIANRIGTNKVVAAEIINPAPDYDVESIVREHR